MIYIYLERLMISSYLEVITTLPELTNIDIFDDIPGSVICLLTLLIMLTNIEWLTPGKDDDKNKDKQENKKKEEIADKTSDEDKSTSTEIQPDPTKQNSPNYILSAALGVLLGFVIIYYLN